jgi:hypothetical protein
MPRNERDVAADPPRSGRKAPFHLTGTAMEFVGEGSMRSLTAGWARQAVVAAAMGPLLIAALMASPDIARHAPAAASLDKPIPTRAIVIAEAPPALSSPAAKPTPLAKARLAAPAPKPIAAAGVRPIVAPAPRPRPAAADLAPQVVAAAYVAPAPEPEPQRPFDLRKQLFAPVGFVRDNVARLMSWL